MLMGPDDGSVDHQPFGVRLDPENLQNRLPKASLAPTVEAGEDAVPRPEFLRQIPPGRTGPVFSENGFEHAPMVLRGRPVFLERLYVVCPGEERFPLGDKIEGVGLSAVQGLLGKK
jgi:hypothetical protein